MDNTKFLVIGDTHGNFNYIKYQIKMMNLSDITLLHVGDFGVGFKKHDVEINDLGHLNKFLKEKNIHLYTIRGNHDDPDFFNGNHDYSNLHLVKDYSVIEVGEDKVLMVGGAVSVDRGPRLAEMREYLKYGNDRASYWPTEIFVLDETKVNELTGINYVITHSSPDFAFPINDTNNHYNSHGGLVEHFVMIGDDKLKNDLNSERENITKMWDIIDKNNKIEKYFYGHFHTSESIKIGDTEFICLNINEFYKVQ